MRYIPVIFEAASVPATLTYPTDNSYYGAQYFLSL